MFVEDIQTRMARNFWTLQNHNLQYSLEAGNKVGLEPLEPFNILVHLVQLHLSLIPQKSSKHASELQGSKVINIYSHPLAIYLYSLA